MRANTLGGGSSLLEKDETSASLTNLVQKRLKRFSVQMMSYFKYRGEDRGGEFRPGTPLVPLSGHLKQQMDHFKVLTVV